MPVYSVVVALYREARVVPQLVAALAAIDYPRGKLDIKLVIEHDDRATRVAIEALDLPATVRFRAVGPSDYGENRSERRGCSVSAVVMASFTVAIIPAIAVAAGATTSVGVC